MYPNPVAARRGRRSLLLAVALIAMVVLVAILTGCADRSTPPPVAHGTPKVILPGEEPKCSPNPRDPYIPCQEP